MMKRSMLAVGVLAGAMFTASLFTVGAQEGGLTTFATNTPMAGLATPTAIQSTAVAPEVTTQVVQVYEPPECEYVEGQSTTQACLDLMAQYPDPIVDDAPKDGYSLETYSFWRVGPSATNTFDAANGNLTGQIPEGFNFVRVVGEAEGWIQSEIGQWINKNDAYYKQPSYFSGVLLPKGWNQPFGWILDTTGIWASLTPGGESTSESELVPLHYERYNIFAEVVDEEGWSWYMVGPNQWVKQTYMVVIKPTARPEGVSGRWVAVDLFEQSLVAYEDDQPVFATLISTGLPAFSTPEGLYNVWARLPRDTMSGSTGAPDAYALQSVPWVQYFNGGISLHGTYWHDFFGYRRSHGCVNLTISDARWVYEFLEEGGTPNEDGVIANYVYVHSTGDYRRG